MKIINGALLKLNQTVNLTHSHARAWSESPMASSVYVENGKL